LGVGTGPVEPRPDAASDADGGRSVAGRWAKARSEPCADLYPDVVEFFEGTFLATKGPAQGFLRWDAGIYHRLAPDRLRIQTATDELVTYPCTVTADELTVLDPEGCRLHYRRLPAAPPGGDSSGTDTKEPM
jgi:hypothetical protein